jgi:P4 family phage/plasmid primase-like protien
MNLPRDEKEILDAVESIYSRLGETENTDVGDIDIMLNVNARDLENGEIEEIRKHLIDQGYIEIEGEPDDKNAKVDKVRVEKFKQDIDYQESHDPREYFTESIHGNEKFDAEKMAEELLTKYNFLKIKGTEKGLKIYNNGIWEDEQHATETIEREVNERLGQETSSHYRSNVKNIIRNHREIQIDDEDFKHPKLLVPFNNGVYDLEKGEFKDYKPEYHFTFKYEAEYKPDLENNDVERFIEEIAPESEDKRKKLHEIAGITIAPWRVKELMPILFGKGSNGKNQYVKVIKKIVGRENYHVTKSKRISKDKFESASIHDAELLFVDEFGHVSDPSDFKRLTDDDQNKRAMHQESEVVDTSVQPIFAANELPTIDDNSDGFYRRWQIINFNQKFTEEDDSNPDKMNPTELEKEYMSKEAIDSYATSLISHLQDVIETNRLTDQQSRSKVRAIWEEKASAVYQFIDKFLTQGNIEYPDDSKVGDYIIKKELTKVVNSYLDDKNMSKTNTQHVTRALEKHPDLEVNTSARPRIGDGLSPDRPTAYEGIRIRDDRVHDVRGVLPLYAWRSQALFRLTNYRKYHDITDKDKTAIALAFLKQHGEDGVNMVELIKELNLSYDELEHINQSDYIIKDNVEKNGTFVPFYKVDEETLEENIEDSDIVYDKHGKSVRPMRWLRDQIDSWSNETIKNKEDLIQKGKSVGFSEEGIESAIENLEDDGIIYEPKPNTVKRM